MSLVVYYSASVAKNLIPLPAGYSALLEELKTRIRTQQQAAFAVNRELLILRTERDDPTIGLLLCESRKVPSS